MKKRMVGIVSLCILLIACYIFRYPLFAWHGMKEFPFYLLIPGIIVIVVSGIIQPGRIAPVFTAAGYIVGFFGGCLPAIPAYDPGGGTLNNMWQIWMNSYGTAMISGILIEVFNRQKNRNR